VALEEPGVAPLWIAAQLVQEDLLIMRRGEDAWRLVAASLSFPSSWSLAEKFGKPLHEIHKPVPGFGPNTRNAALIARIFDNLQVEIPVLRWNFSLYGDGELHHSEPGNPRGRGFGDDPASIFFRVERQTIRKLAVSGDILFTVRIYAEPLSVLAAQPDGAAIAAWLADRLDALDADQLAYKGLTDERGKLVRRLWEIAGG
jgi:hypothetical protein